MKVESFRMFGGGRQTFPTHRVTFTTDFQLEREKGKGIYINDMWPPQKETAALHHFS